MRKTPMSASVLLVALTASLAGAQGTYYRDANGKWQALKVTASGQSVGFTLSPQLVSGGSTTVVLDKPKWMVLDDETAPTVTKVLLDGQERAADALDLGWQPAAPAELAVALKDDKNPLDLTDLDLTLDNAPLPTAQRTITKLTPDGKQARVAIKLGTLPPARHVLQVAVSDLAPLRNTTTLALRFNTAPLLLNGSFEEVDAAGAPVAWQPGAWSSDAQTKYTIDVKPGGVAGEKALRFEGLAGSLNLVCAQRVDDLKAGQVYVFTGQYKSAAGCALSAISNVGGKQLDYLSQGLPASADWKPFAWEFKLQEHEYAQIVVRTGNKGESWFDDLKLLPKP